METKNKPPFKRVLVIKLSAFGDFVLTFGVFSALRRHHADARITLMTTKLFQGLAEKSGYFDDIWIVGKWPFWQIRDWRGLWRRLRSGGFDCVYDLQRNDRTKIFRRLAPAALRRKWFGKPKNEDKAYDILSITNVKQFPIPDMSWADADINAFNISAPFVLLVPGCAPQHPEKRWPGGHYISLAHEIRARGYTPVLIGTAAEEGTLQEISSAVPGTVNLCGRTSFMDIAALARQATAAVGNDTGPMHLVAMIGCPSVSLFSGASDPAQSAPYGASVSVLRAIPIEGLPVADVLAAFSKIARVQPNAASTTTGR